MMNKDPFSKRLLFGSVLAATLALGGCEKAKDEPAPKPAPAATATPGGSVAPTPAEGPRRVAIKVDNTGYTPAKIQAKPNEKLILVFTRTEESECTKEVVVPGAGTIALPVGKSVEVPLTAAASGEVTFACWMDMFRGAVVTS